MREYATYLSSASYEKDLSTMQELRQMMRDVPQETVVEHSGWSLDRFLHALQYPKFAQGANTFGQFHPVWIRTKAFYRWFFGPTGPVLTGTVSGGHGDTRLRRWKAYVEFSVLYGTHEFAPVLEHNAYYHGRPLKRRFVSGSSMIRGLRAPKRALPPGAGTGHGRKRGQKSPFTPLLCVRITQEMMTGHVAKRFLNTTYASTQETHDRVLDVVRRVRARFVTLVNETWWLQPKDKNATMDKLRAIEIRVAQPHHWSAEPFGTEVTKVSHFVYIT